jgi:putative transposase
VIGQGRSTHRYERLLSDEEKRLVAQILELAARHPRYGYRRVTALLRRDGWRVNRKRVHRIWREEGLKITAKPRKRRRLGNSEQGSQRRRAEYGGDVWSYDFVMDQSEDGRRLKMLPIVDEYTRECLTVEVRRHFTSGDVIRTLERLFEERGAPEFIRSDNGPEFIATAVKEWLKEKKVSTLYIEPGSPWENAYAESFNSRFRDELLDRELFVSLLEAKVLVAEYVKEYNQHRPHSALGYQTPAAFALAEINNRLSLHLVHNSGARHLNLHSFLRDHPLFQLERGRRLYAQERSFPHGRLPA